ELLDDLLAKQAVDIRRGGDLEAGKNFLGHARPADKVAPLEDQHFPAGLGEVTGCDKAVVARADDDCVVRCCHALCPHVELHGSAMLRRGRLRFAPAFAFPPLDAGNRLLLASLAPTPVLCHPRENSPCNQKSAPGAEHSLYESPKPFW